MNKKIRNELLFEALIFTLALFFLVTLWKYNLLLTLLLLALYLVGKRFWHKKHDHVFYIFGATLGTLAEIIGTHFNVWTYSNPTFLNIPLWLPFAWGLVVLMMVRIVETFVKIEKR